MLNHKVYSSNIKESKTQEAFERIALLPKKQQKTLQRPSIDHVDNMNLFVSLIVDFLCVYYFWEEGNTLVKLLCIFSI